VQHDDEPEDEQERSFLRLVPEMPLGEHGTGPSTQERQDLKGTFGNSPTAVERLFFVEAIGSEGDQEHHEDNAEISQKKTRSEFHAAFTSLRSSIWCQGTFAPS